MSYTVDKNSMRVQMVGYGLVRFTTIHDLIKQAARNGACTPV